MNSPRTAAPQLPITLILIAAFAAALGLWLGSSAFLRLARRAADEDAVLYPTPRALPDFKLTQRRRQPLTLADWNGHWTVAFFGYTNCPDVCPTTLATFKQVCERLAATASRDNVRFDFISVDPQRDTPEKLAKYVGFFNPDFIAATGTDEELTKLTRSARPHVYARADRQRQHRRSITARSVGASSIRGRETARPVPPAVRRAGRSPPICKSLMRSAR